MRSSCLRECCLQAGRAWASTAARWWVKAAWVSICVFVRVRSLLLCCLVGNWNLLRDLTVLVSAEHILYSSFAAADYASMRLSSELSWDVFVAVLTYLTSLISQLICCVVVVLSRAKSVKDVTLLSFDFLSFVWMISASVCVSQFSEEPLKSN